MKFILKRLLQTIPVIFLVAFFSFAIIEIAPGDVLMHYIRPNMTNEEIEELKEELGLNDGIVEKFCGWGKNVLKGNWGYSQINHRSVTEQIKEKFPATIGLMGAALILSIVMSIPLGLISGVNKGKPIDRIISDISYIGNSIPPFWFGIMLIIVFSLKLNWLPSMGMRTVGVDSVWDVIKHGILPAIVLSTKNTAVFTRYIRANTISQMEEEYVDTAISKGASKNRIVYCHVMKNCLLPIITLAGMNLSGLVVGSFIVESVFSWPGMGTLGMAAINARDYPVVMGFTMISCVILILGNFIADILYGICDPRIDQREGDEVDG